MSAYWLTPEGLFLSLKNRYQYQMFKGLDQLSNLRHECFGVSKVLSLVHAQSTGTTTETVTFGTEFSAVALFAIEGTLVLIVVSAVQSFVAKICQQIISQFLSIQ